MILYVQGDIFQSPAHVLVNTVNTVGVMGKGIALQFKRMFPEMFDQYRHLCETNQLNIGTLWLYKTPNKWVLNFPTKTHWRQPSKIEYIEAGLKKFVQTYHELNIHSIAFPPLGCGNGQLDFESQVKPLMEQYLRNLPIDTFIYPHRHSDFVEHVNTVEMKRWLRTEPQSLPFSEVWEDISRILDNKQQFTTVARGSTFAAKLLSDPQGIQVQTESTTKKIPYDLLMSVWQQLRAHGFSTRYISPGLSSEWSYIVPIFAELDYVAPVKLADQHRPSPVIGLQILPGAFSRQTNHEPQAAIQVPLFNE